MSSPVRIALDAMGGDHGPESTIPGAALALQENPQVGFLIFGDEIILKPLLDKYPALKAASVLYHTDKTVRGDEKPSIALRSSKGSSMRMAVEAVQDGRASAVVSAGNTGALMALAKLVLKPLPGVHRPALASVLPSFEGETVMLDLGANVLVDAENLVQFAVLGATFARIYKNIEMPSVGLLNVGSEDMKGPDHVRQAAKILSRIDFSGRYYGFVEGNDITNGTVDVVVSDGYAGNIALKTAEGVGKLTRHYFKKFIKSDPFALVGGLLAFFALRRFRDRLDPRRYNGGVFLGLNGVCIKSHGGCDALAFSSAVKLAVGLAEQDYIGTVAHDINHLMTQESFHSQDSL
ncbi:MAG: phosphate acyltransferase PlsX [Alphaproteobacteria bacterium]|nr:phosphate acyltransferase PlsX [Alphaproteobacteria bacterium]